MLTPSQLQHNGRKSGYVGVAYSPAHTINEFQPYHDGPGGRWYGPRCGSALEAAQLVCDYVNNGTAPPPTTLKSAGHKRPQQRSVPTDPEVAAALGVLRDHRAQRRGAQGYVYLIAENVKYDGTLGNGKIGYSCSPEKRVAELQTGNPRPLVVLRSMKGTEADERALHAKYIKDNILQEWFNITPALLAEFPRPDQGVK